MARPSATRSAAAAASDPPPAVPSRGADERLSDVAGEQLHRLVEPGQRPREALHVRCHRRTSVRAAAVSSSRPSATVHPPPRRARPEPRPDVTLRSRASAGSASPRPARALGSPSSTMAPSSTTRTRSNVRASLTSWLMQSSVASRQCSRTKAQQRAAGGSIEPAERLVEHDEPDVGPQQSARPSRTRWPSPPETSAPPSPRGVCRPSGSFSTSSCRLAAVTAKPAAWGSPRASFRTAGSRTAMRFQSCTDGSTHAVDSPEMAARLDVERIAVDQQPAGRRRVPAEKKADQRRLSRTGRADDGNVRARRNRADRPHGSNDRPAACTSTRSMTIEAPPVARRSGRRRRSRGGQHGRRQQRFDHAQHDVARCRELPGEQRDLVTQRGDAQRPVEQQERTGIAAAREDAPTAARPRRRTRHAACSDSIATAARTDCTPLASHSRITRPCSRRTARSAPCVRMGTRPSSASK